MAETGFNETVEYGVVKIPVSRKEIIYYRYIQELPMNEICEIMNLSYQSAQNLIQKAFHKISTDEDRIRSKKLRPQIVILFLCFFEMY